jgi:hypothetical protein
VVGLLISLPETSEAVERVVAELGTAHFMLKQVKSIGETGLFSVYASTMFSALLQPIRLFTFHCIYAFA